MQNYDTYTPEINYGEDPHVSAGTENPADGRPARVARRRSQIKNTKKPESEQEKKAPKTSGPSWLKRVKDWFAGPQFRILSGIFLGCLTIYLAVSFCSYFTTCIRDQSKIASAPIGMAAGVANPGGEGGARLSELLINEGFGLGSLVIVIWLGALTLKLLVGKPRFRALDFTIKCLVALITVSLIIGLVTYNMHLQVNWGGYHGTYVNEAIIHFIGNVGAGLLSIFMIALFIMICLRDLVNWMIRKRRARMERRRKEMEAKAAREAMEEKIRQMQAQEKIEDLRAGQAAEFQPHDNTDVDEEQEEVRFEGEQGSIYDLSMQEDPLENEPAQPAAEAEHKEDHTEEPDKSEEPDLSDQLDQADMSDKSDESESTGKSDEASDGGAKMVVNVNEIGTTDAKRFTPDVVAYENQNYRFPPYDLLREGKERVTLDTTEQLENKQRIEKTLLDFGIPITKIEATVGPTVTLYEIVPDNGVKISKIRGLVDDIALSLSATGVRIIAPIPGKGTVGIEVANKDAQAVSMRTVIQSKKYQDTRCNLPLALGSTISNEVYVADLAKMPHLLVGGATGQGKSVGLNAMIASLLYCKAPHEMKFVMIDPKQVEFSLYNKLKNYYMAAIPGEEDEPVITDMDKVEATLNSLCVEMENRYTLLKTAHVRNVEEYNSKIREGRLNPKEGHKFLPYIVVIVDEFGDLVMVKGKAIEMPIARLAQKARAVGMHVIIATQRPSANVITGIIKANFPARVSFKVSSGVDSKTIIDTTGAQALIGRGDMLIFYNSELVRVQCAFIDTPEVEALCDYVERQPYPQGVYMLPDPPMGEGGESVGGPQGPLGDKDPLLVEVARAVVNSGRASTSSVQRTYEIGYNRAGRIMDQLERLGVVGPSLGGKPRSVLVDPMKLEEILGEMD